MNHICGNLKPENQKRNNGIWNLENRDLRCLMIRDLQKRKIWDLKKSSSSAEQFEEIVIVCRSRSLQEVVVCNTDSGTRKSSSSAATAISLKNLGRGPAESIWACNKSSSAARTEMRKRCRCLRHLERAISLNTKICEITGGSGNLRGNRWFVRRLEICSTDWNAEEMSLSASSGTCNQFEHGDSWDYRRIWKSYRKSEIRASSGNLGCGSASSTHGVWNAERGIVVEQNAWTRNWIAVLAEEERKKKLHFLW